MERFTLEVNYQRLAVRNLEESFKVVSFYFFWVVIYIELHLFSWLKLSETWMNIENLVVENMFLEGLFGCWLSRIGPRFHLDFGVIGQFELPICLNTSNILDCQSNLPRFGPIFDRDFAEGPVENCQVPDEFIQALVRLIRVVKDFLTIVKWIEKVFIHFGHIETLPEVCDTLLVVSYVLESEQRIITFGLNGNETLFDHIFNVVLGLHDVCLNLLVHSLTSHTYQVNIKIESQLWFERYANSFLRLSIDDTFRSIKMEILVKDLSKGAQFFGGVLGLSALLLSFWCHFEFNEDVAIAAVINSSLHGLVESYSDRTKVNVHRLDLNYTIASSANNFECVFLDKIGWCNEWTSFT